jgi:hypothetical protein
MLPAPTKIKAIAEDPKSPFLECYDATNIESLAAIAVSRAFANNPTTTTIPNPINPIPTTTKKEATTMSVENFGNPNYVTSTPSKRFVSGIMGIDNPVALVKTLNRLGLCPNAMAEPLQALAAAKRSLAEFFTVSVYEVDLALKDVECSPQDRIGFKNSLLRAGLMTA